MRKFIIKIFIWILCLTLFIHIPLFFRHDEYYSSSHLMNIDRSIRKLDSIPGRRIILLGGSNVGFSINSKEIEDVFHVPVVNTGTHACIGMRAQVLLYDKYFHKEDIVIFCPEYEQFELTYFFGKDILIQHLFNTTQKRCKLSFLQVIYLIDDYLYYMKTLALNNYRKVPEDKVYNVNALNIYGDAIKHRTMNPLNVLVQKDLDCFSQHTVRFLKSYSESLNAKDIKFCLLPPVIRDTDFYVNIDYINQVESTLERFEIPYLSSPERYILPKSCFYNTRYHCIQKGASIRTNLLIEDISKLIHP